MDFPYITHFVSTAYIVKGTEPEVYTAMASLRNLHGIVPAELDIEGNPDLLYIAANAATPGLCNRNDDCISPACAITIHRTALHKYIDVEHKINDICGVVLKAALSRFGTNEPLTDEEAASLTEPFNMAIVGALWKRVNEKVTQYLYLVGDSTGSEAFSLSWEIAFLNYSIAVGPRELAKARIITPEDPQFAIYDKKLRVNGGPGKDEAGQPVYRVIDGPAVILGYGIVSDPAAHVKGILPLEEAKNDAVVETQPAEPAAASTQKSEEIIITPANTSVNPITITPMKIESLEQLTSKWGEIRLLESAAAVVDFVTTLQKGADDMVAKVTESETALKAAQDARAAAEQARAQLEARATELQNEVTSIKAQLQKVADEAAAAAATQKFNERMASFDEKFDLDDDDRKLIAEDIRAIETDEAFDAYAKKQEKLMAQKKKGAKKSACDKDMDDEEAKKKAAAASTAIASTTELPNQSVVNTTSPDTTLLDQMNAAFVVCNYGKPVVEKK